MKRLLAMIVAVMMISGALLVGCNAGGSYKDGSWYKSLDSNHDGMVSKDEEKGQAAGM